MRKNFGNKPLCYPQPVFILSAYDENDIANSMNAAWGGINEDEEIFLCISNYHKTTKNILTSKAFTVSMGEAKYVKECDYLGIASGLQVANKLEVVGFTTTKSEFVNAPVIDQLSICVECELKSYDPETCRIIGVIKNVAVDERVLDEEGKVDINKVEPISLDPFNHTYVKLTDTVGNAFKDGLAFK